MPEISPLLSGCPLHRRQKVFERRVSAAMNRSKNHNGIRKSRIGILAKLGGAPALSGRYGRGWSHSRCRRSGHPLAQSRAAVGGSPTRRSRTLSDRVWRPRASANRIRPSPILGQDTIAFTLAGSLVLLGGVTFEQANASGVIHRSADAHPRIRDRWPNARSRPQLDCRRGKQLGRPDAPTSRYRLLEIVREKLEGIG